VTRREHTLVTSGPYRRVRHPFYDATGLAILATSLTAANWFVLLTGGLAFTLMMIRTRTEEQHVLARLGESYRAYMERTGRFVPRIRARGRRSRARGGEAAGGSSGRYGSAPVGPAATRGQETALPMRIQDAN
jgi:hypothetical protein